MGFTPALKYPKNLGEVGVGIPLAPSQPPAAAPCPELGFRRFASGVKSEKLMVVGPFLWCVSSSGSFEGRADLHPLDPVRQRSSEALLFLKAAGEENCTWA